MTYKSFIFWILLLQVSFSFSQLGFCSGTKGEPIFLENFGSGTTYGPALAAGVTNYNYVNAGFPQDGEYTLFHRTNLIPNSQNWHYSLDHTPDTEPNGTNGKCLIVNASNTPGQFYNRTVTGLCSNTTFEFSAWLMNIVNSASGGCSGTSGIPINVTFEIWNATNTVLLQSGSTGNIAGASSPSWNQFGLVFTMGAGQTSVILKMRNNGAGGCGNDLAIDDIMFRACGASSSISNAGNPSNTITVCQNQAISNTTLVVTSAAPATTVYQWQQSTDGVNFTSIVGATNTTYTLPSALPSTSAYYRVKLANDIANINNNFCSTISDVFSVLVRPLPNAPLSSGDVVQCTNATNTLTVTVGANDSVNWYDAPTNGNLLQSNATTFTPSTLGTYYAQAYSTTTGCLSANRTPVSLVAAHTASFTGVTTICSGNPIQLVLAATSATATFSWTATSSDVTGFGSGSGSIINQTLSYAGTSSGTVIYTVLPKVGSCEGVPLTITVTVQPKSSVNLQFPVLPTTYCENATAMVLPNTSSNSTPVNGTWNPSTIDTSVLGTSSYTFTPQSDPCVSYAPYSLTVTITNSGQPNFDSNITFCTGAIPLVLATISPNGITGTWNPLTIDPLLSGTYTFTTDPNQCSNSQTITTTVISPSLILVSYTLSEAFSNQPLLTVLASGGTGSYLYQLDAGVLQSSPIFENLSSGSHLLTVYDRFGCASSESVSLFVVNHPLFFTPNGDGINDFWTVPVPSTIQDVLISIFDRYGKLVFQFQPSNLGWDGSFNGKSMPATDYWFTIDFKENGEAKLFKSHFSLIR